MRLAYVCADSGVPVFGGKGSSVHVQEVVRAMRLRGIEIELFARRIDADPPPDLAGVIVHELSPIPKGDIALREQAALAANGTLRTALELHGPFDAVYERYSLWSYAAMEYARDFGIPGLMEVNAPLISEQARHRDLVDRESAERVAEQAFGAATVLLPVSQGVADYLGQYPGARGRTHVVPNGVNPERFPENLTPTYPPEPGVFTIGFVGTLKPWHGLSILIDAFDWLYRHDSTIRLLIVGDGPERERLIHDVATRGLANAVHYTGAVHPGDVPGLLASMDVAVAPYPDQPNFYFSPLKVYEYMAAGLPVVASRIGQLTDLIEHGTNGLLYTPDDVSTLSAALSLLRSDPFLRSRLGREARRTVLQRHTWAAVVGRIFRVAGLESALRRQDTLVGG